MYKSIYKVFKWRKFFLWLTINQFLVTDSQLIRNLIHSFNLYLLNIDSPCFGQGAGPGFAVMEWNNLLLLFSHSVMSDSLSPHGLQHTRLCRPSPSPRVCSNSHPLCWWMPSNHLILCRPLLLLPSIFPATGSFPMSRLLAPGGQSIGASASASVIPMNSQDWFPLELTGLISLLSKGLSRNFSSSIVWRHQFFGP